MRMDRREERLQRALVAYLRLALPKPWLVFCVPNGGGRSKAEAGVFKALGVLAGMPDLFVLGPRFRIHPHPSGGYEREVRPDIIAIEFKAPPKRLKSGGVSKARPALSPVQRARQLDLGSCGVPYLVIDDMADMIQALRALGVPLKGRAM